MKIVLGLVAVLILLLGMIAAIGNHDGSIVFGDPPAGDATPGGSSPATGLEKAYLELVVSALQIVSSDIYALGGLFSQPELEDEMWRASVVILLNRIEMGHDAIVILEPSPRLQPFQDMAVVALGHSAEFAKIIRAGLVEGRAELTNEAAVELMAAAESFGQSEDLLNEFLAAHPLAE